MKKIGFEQDRTRDLKTGGPDHYVDTTHASVDDVSRSHCVQIIGFGLTFMLCFAQPELQQMQFRTIPSDPVACFCAKFELVILCTITLAIPYKVFMDSFRFIFYLLNVCLRFLRNGVNKLCHKSENLFFYIKESVRLIEFASEPTVDYVDLYDSLAVLPRSSTLLTKCGPQIVLLFHSKRSYSPPFLIRQTSVCPFDQKRSRVFFRFSLSASRFNSEIPSRRELEKIQVAYTSPISKRGGEAPGTKRGPECIITGRIPGAVFQKGSQTELGNACSGPFLTFV